MNDQKKTNSKIDWDKFRENARRALFFVGGLAAISLVYGKANLLNAQAEGIRVNIENAKRRDQREEKLYGAQVSYYDGLEMRELERMEAEETARMAAESKKQ